MAVAFPNSTLSKSKFLNWIKAALAILITKEEIEPVVYNEKAQFQQKCLQDIATSNSLPAGSTCSNCSTESVIICPTNRICNVKRGKCSYHRNFATQYRPSGCPNNICDNLKSEIQIAHRYNGPSYKNTDAKHWCSNPWEIAKCYMPPDGYKDVTNAADTDFNGIISVIINHNGFDAKINDDLSKRNNIFEEGREVGRAVRHSPNLEVEDVDLTKYVTIMNNILTDPGFKVINNSPHNASQKLAQLQNDDLIIGEDVVRKVLEDVGKAIQEQIKNEMNACREVTEKQKEDLLDTFREKLNAIDIRGDVSIAQLNEKLNESFDGLKDLVKVSVEEIKNQIQEGKKDINKEKERALNQILEGRKELNEEKERAIKEITDKSGGYRTGVMREEIYQKQKQELKEKLIKFYKDKRSTVPLSPLVEEVETNLAGFYVMPEMVFVTQKSLTSHEEERTPVRSLRNLLIPESEDQQNLYLSADAGFGKTSFSKYLAITWGQACCPDKNQDCFKNEELKALANFEFLFLVLLRDTAAVCYIDEMIEQQIIKKVSLSGSQCSLQEVLEREKCLIILDGLDEWTHPDNGCSGQKEKIPHRYSRDKCVILTTTRPWKLGVSNLKTNDVNRKVELVQLSKYSTRQLEKNAIRKMSGVRNENELERKTSDFHRDIVSRGIEHMQTIPLLLMYITCLWCNKVPIGNSKVGVYINIIEFLLSRTTQKHPEVNPLSEPPHSDISELFKKLTCKENNCQEPNCEKHKQKFCQKFCSLLTCLAELAYHTLFYEKRENTLVFDGSVAEKYLKADDMKLGFLSGILTGSTSTTLIERTTKVSFSHKTVQEFFAAICISSQSDGQKTVEKKCKTVQSILDMSMTWEFLSKMNSKMMCEISAGLMSVINLDMETRKFRTRTDHIYSGQLYNIQKMLVSLLQEIPQFENIKLCLQDFFISTYITNIHDKHLQRLLRLNKTNMKTLFINTHNSSISLRKLNETFSLTDLDNLHKLYYKDVGNREADFNLLLFPGLQSVYLRSATWTNYEGNLSEKLRAMKNVQYLHISELTLSHEILEIIYNFISGNKAMKELILEELYCKDHDRHDCTGNFHLSVNHSEPKKLRLKWLPPLNLTVTSQSLVNVRLENINLGEKSLLLSRDMLNIKRVELEDIRISAKSFRNLVHVVEKLPQSVTVKIWNCNIETETEYERVRNYIRSSHTFVVKRDGDWWFKFQTTTTTAAIESLSSEKEKTTTMNTKTTGSLSSEQETTTTTTPTMTGSLSSEQETPTTTMTTTGSLSSKHESTTTMTTDIASSKQENQTKNRKKKRCVIN